MQFFDSIRTEEAFAQAFSTREAVTKPCRSRERDTLAPLCTNHEGLYIYI